MTPTPDFPAGPPPADAPADREALDACTAAIRGFPAGLRAAVEPLGDATLDRRYRRWTVRQVVGHLADSHAHALLRFKLALTEDRPRIKPYDEAATVRLADSAGGAVADALLQLDGIHGRWARLLDAMEDAAFARAYVHPATGEAVTLARAAGEDAWHGRHHLAQVRWVVERADAGGR